MGVTVTWLRILHIQPTVDSLEHLSVYWRYLHLSALLRWDLAICSCLLLALAYWIASQLSVVRIQWYHADSTVELKSKEDGKTSLSQVCKSITPPLYLNPLIFNSHLQTILSLIDKRDFTLHFRRLIFNSFNPGYKGTYEVDISVPAFEDHDPKLPPRTAYYVDDEQRHIQSDDSDPMIIALHGLCGGSHETYLQHVLAPLVESEQNWKACVLLSRGCGQSSITGGGMYYAHATSDLRQLIRWLQLVFPNRSLYGLGFSMGANILTRYVAEEGDDCVLKAAVVVSNPWNLEVVALHLQRTFTGRYIYSPAMTKNLMSVFMRNQQKIKKLDGSPLDAEGASRIRLMHEYDRHIQCPTWGFPTERVYYRKASSSDSVLKVKIPFWAINAEDDPIIGVESVPKHEFQVSPNTILCITAKGGHLGWFEPDGGRWYAGAIVSYLTKMYTMQKVQDPLQKKERTPSPPFTIRRLNTT